MSDIERLFDNIPAFKPKNKAQRNEDRRNKLFSKTQPVELDEWFVYLVDGEKWYFKASQDLAILKMHHDVEFLGIGRPNRAVHKIAINNEIKEIKSKLSVAYIAPKKVNYQKDYGRCCYCEVQLTYNHIKDPTHKTREHVIPKSKGGKIIKPCCFECNQEKGGLMLHSYIQFLNYRLMEVSPDELVKLQRKIKNANKIAIEIATLGTMP